MADTAASAQDVNVQIPGDAKAAPASANPAEAEAAAANAAPFALRIRVPNVSKPLTVTCSPWDNPAVLRESLLATAECALHTAFDFVMTKAAGGQAVPAQAGDSGRGEWISTSSTSTKSGMVLNEWTPFHEYGELVGPGMELTLVPTLYDKAGVRFHVTRMLDVLMFPRRAMNDAPPSDVEPMWMPSAKEMAQNAMQKKQREELQMQLAAATESRIAAAQHVKTAQKTLTELNAAASKKDDGGEGAATDAVASVTEEKKEAVKQDLASALEEFKESGKALSTVQSNVASVRRKQVRSQLKRWENELQSHPISPAGSLTDVTRSAVSELFRQAVGDAVAMVRCRQVTDGLLPSCLESLCFSEFNPPPSSRVLAGDIAYLKAVTHEKQTLHITANAQGFYVNMSRGDTFNPLPSPTPFFSHTLADVLSGMSNTFRRNLTALSEVANILHAKFPDMTPAEVIDSARPAGPPMEVRVPFMNSEAHSDFSLSWVAPTAPSEDKLANMVKTVVAEQSASLGRDWNDELQGELSLPSATRQEKYTRWQVVHSTRTAFMHAAVEGAMKVFNGEVPALNPLVVPQHRVYVHNYIFFSQVCSSDTREDDLEQDPASLLPEEAHCRLNHDLLISRELQNMDTLGAQDLHSVMTVVVDYLGQRLVAQSIIPGILQSTEVGRVIYGSGDQGETVSRDDAVHGVLKKAIAQRFHLAERTVTPFGRAAATSDAEPSTADAETSEPTPVSLIGPMESKFVKGGDARMYVLDIGRWTPVDTNYVDPKHPRASQNRRRLLRPELVRAFVTYKQRQELRKALKAKQQGEGADAAATAESTTDSTATSTDAGAGAGAGAGPGAGAGAGAEVTMEEVDSDSDASANAKAEGTTKADAFAKAASEISPILFNVNAFTPFCKGQDAEQLAADEALVKEAGDFLARVVLPLFHKQLCTLEMVDLTSSMHAHGINMRYLGRLARMTAFKLETGKDKSNLRHALGRLETEMVVRAAKRLFKKLLSDGVMRAAPAAAIASFLNALLGSSGSSSGSAAPPAGDGGSSTATTDVGASVATAAPVVAAGRGRGAKKKKRGRGGGKKRGGKVHNTPQNGNAAGTGAAATTPDNTLGGALSAWSALPAMSVKFAEGVAGFKLTSEGVWGAIADVVKTRYQWELRLWGPDTAPVADAERKAEFVSHTATLRALCLATGVRVAGREYDFSTATPFRACDVVDVVPVVKHSLPLDSVPLVKSLRAMAHREMSAGRWQIATDMLRMGAQAVAEVMGRGHAAYAEAASLLAMAYHQQHHNANAVMAQTQATFFFERTCGLDDFRTSQAYMLLGNYQQQYGDINGAITSWNRSISLAKVAYGADAGPLVNVYYKVAMLYKSMKKLDMAGDALMEALNIALHREATVMIIEIFQQISLINEANKKIQAAINSMQAALRYLIEAFGKDHERTVVAATRLERLKKELAAASAATKKSQPKSKSKSKSKRK